MPDWLATLLISLLKAVLVVLALLTTFAYMTLIERRLLGRMQLRPGPNRVGPMGLLQPAADHGDTPVPVNDPSYALLAPLFARGAGR